MVKVVCLIVILLCNIAILITSIIVNRSVEREIKSQKDVRKSAEQEIIEHAKRLGVKIGEE